MREELIVKDNLLRSLTLCRLLWGFSALILAANEVQSSTITAHGTENTPSPPEEDLGRLSPSGGGGCRATGVLTHLPVPPLSLGLACKDPSGTPSPA